MKDFLVTKVELEGKLFHLAGYFEDMHLVDLRLEDPSLASHVGGVYLGSLESRARSTGGAFVRLGAAGICFLKSYEKKKTDGGRVLAQVTKDAAGNKQAAASQNIRLPGQYSVVSASEEALTAVFAGPAESGNPVQSAPKEPSEIPGACPASPAECRDTLSLPAVGSGVSPLAVSAKLSPAEKRRLRELFAGEFSFPDCEVLLRTEAASAEPSAIRGEVADLRARLQTILAQAPKARTGACLYLPDPFYLRFFDLTAPSPDRLLTDLPQAEKPLRELAAAREIAFAEKRPGALSYTELYGLKTELTRLLGKCAHLSCGAELIIQPTEAFVSVDVNSARFRGAGTPKRNARRINEEAVRELFRQMRLRNLSGMILTDLINMEDLQDREAVLGLARELAAREHVRTEAVDITPLGILEILREKNGPTLWQTVFGGRTN